MTDAGLDDDYKALYGEVVTEDIYRLKQLSFVPDVVFDIGANIGIFTRYARDLWPVARIVAVEPHPDNIFEFNRLTPWNDQNIFLVPHALGTGPIFHGTGARNGSGETYLSHGLGYAEGSLNSHSSTAMIGRSLASIVRPHWCPGQKAVIKMDCEGAENCIWEDPESMAVLRRFDYIAMEVHFYAADAEQHPEMKEKTLAALKSLEATHECELDNVNFWATKKLNTKC